MLDFNSKSLMANRLNNYIDSALEIEQFFQPRRTYLGGSRLGAECERQLQYEYLGVPVDEGKAFNGRVLRIFARGHWVESAMVEWCRTAGFGLVPATKDGGQFGFTSEGDKVKGHCDGIFVSGPQEFGPYPKLWENKGINDKAFKELVKNGLKKQYPVYYAQIQKYMKEFRLTKNPALFSAVNLNDMEIYWEEVEYDEEFTKMLDHKANRILLACESGEMLPRTFEQTYFKCKWCNWHNRCWEEK